MVLAPTPGMLVEEMLERVRGCTSAAAKQALHVIIATNATAEHDFYGTLKRLCGVLRCNSWAVGLSSQEAGNLSKRDGLLAIAHIAAAAARA
eukprot:3451741-Amphidinium_carterae.3